MSTKCIHELSGIRKQTKERDKRVSFKIHLNIQNIFQGVFLFIFFCTFVQDCQRGRIKTMTLKRHRFKNEIDNTEILPTTNYPRFILELSDSVKLNSITCKVEKRVTFLTQNLSVCIF